MKFRMFAFELLNFHLDTDGEFVFILGHWDTADFDGEILAVMRSHSGVWRVDFLCLKRIYEWLSGR